MQMDIAVPLEQSIGEQVRLITRAEELSFDGACIADHVEHGHDVFTTLAAAAGKTNRIRLFPCVTNPISRHPWVLANIALTMNELTSGRFHLIVGAGDSVMTHTGKRPAKVAEMREAITAIRRLMRGEAVSFGAATEERIIGAKEPAPAVVMAAGARRMTEVAGEVADDVFLLTGHDERIFAMIRRHLAEGAARSGRSVDGFELGHYTVIRIENDKEAAAEFGRPRMLSWLKRGFFRSSLAEIGFPPSALENPDDIPPQELDKMWEALFLIGPFEEIAERIEEIARSGTLGRMICVPSGGQGWESTAQALAGRVLANVK